MVLYNGLLFTWAIFIYQILNCLVSDVAQIIQKNGMKSSSLNNFKQQINFF